MNLKSLITVAIFTSPFILVPQIKGGLEEIISASATQQRNSENKAGRYQTILREIRKKQKDYANQYSRVSLKEKKLILEKSRKFVLDQIVNFLIPAWYGTSWDFNGTSQVPRQGKIACGYFISTILQHAGFNVERITMAQQTAENIVKTLSKEIQRFSNKPVEYFIEKTKARGYGLYVVGLDIHGGFLVNKREGLYFCHSSYYPPYEVLCEKAQESGPIIDSRYKVVGKILEDELMGRWLNHTRIKTVKE